MQIFNISIFIIIITQLNLGKILAKQDGMAKKLAAINKMISLKIFLSRLMSSKILNDSYHCKCYTFKRTSWQNFVREVHLS